MCQFSNGLSVCNSWVRGKTVRSYFKRADYYRGEVEGTAMEENKETSSGTGVKHGGSGSQEIRV